MLPRSTANEHCCPDFFSLHSPRGITHPSVRWLSRLPKHTLGRERLQQGADYNAGLCPTACTPRGKGFAPRQDCWRQQQGQARRLEQPEPCPAGDGSAAVTPPGSSQHAGGVAKGLTQILLGQTIPNCCFLVSAQTCQTDPQMPALATQAQQPRFQAEDLSGRLLWTPVYCQQIQLPLG